MAQHVHKPKYQKRAAKRAGKLYGPKHIDQISTKTIAHNEDLPGAGLFPCFECDRFFIDEKTLNGHKKTKPHKRRLKELKTTPYTIKESERCAGLF
ncbi:hypothetical protein COBT_000067 [Conglomerata obtusa]